MSGRKVADRRVAASSTEVCERLLDAVQFDFVAACAGRALAEVRLPGRVRPSKGCSTGFLIPSGAPPEESAGADGDFERDPESAGLAEDLTAARSKGRTDDAGKLGLPLLSSMSLSIDFRSQQISYALRGSPAGGK
ncbi:MAG: hypothetical protein ACREIU_11725 [Planctomycetota bacterium]